MGFRFSLHLLSAVLTAGGSAALLVLSRKPSLSLLQRRGSIAGGILGAGLFVGSLENLLTPVSDRVAITLDGIAITLYVLALVVGVPVLKGWRRANDR